MKNTLLKGVLLPLVMFLALACNSKKEEPAAPVIDKEQVKMEIQARENEFAELYNSRQLADIGYYADDAISYSQNKPPLVGRKSIAEFWKANLDSNDNNNKITFTTKEVFLSNDGVNVVEIGYYALTDSVTNEVINTGNYMSVFEKRDGKYVCLRDMSTSDMPLE